MEIEQLSFPKPANVSAFQFDLSPFPRPWSRPTFQEDPIESVSLPANAPPRMSSGVPALRGIEKINDSTIVRKLREVIDRMKSRWLLLAAGVIDDTMYGRARRCRKILDVSPRTQQPTRRGATRRVASGPLDFSILLIPINEPASLIAQWFHGTPRNRVRLRRERRRWIQSFVRFQGTSSAFPILEGCFIDFTIVTGPSTTVDSDRFPTAFIVSAIRFPSRLPNLASFFFFTCLAICHPYEIQYLNEFRCVSIRGRLRCSGPDHHRRGPMHSGERKLAQDVEIRFDEPTGRQVEAGRSSGTRVLSPLDFIQGLRSEHWRYVDSFYGGWGGATAIRSWNSGRHRCPLSWRGVRGFLASHHRRDSNEFPSIKGKPLFITLLTTAFNCARYFVHRLFRPLTP